jgi:hypothetical protein
VDTSIIIIIFALLIVSVVGSIIFSKKEEAASLRRQQVASFRYRADEAQDLYDGLQKAGLEMVTYQFLLERMIGNLQQAYNIDARSPGIKTRLNSAKNTLSNLDNVQFQVQIPSSMIDLHGLVGRLNKLVKYLIILFQNRSIDEQKYKQLMPAIQRTLLRFDAEGHIKMGHQAANDGQPGTAKQCYLHAKDKLLNSGYEDSYVTAQLEKVDELIITLEEEVRPIVATSAGSENSPDIVNTIAVEPEVSKKRIETKETQEKLNKKSDSVDTFGNKKKW